MYFIYTEFKVYQNLIQIQTAMLEDLVQLRSQVHTLTAKHDSDQTCYLPSHDLVVLSTSKSLIDSCQSALDTMV